MPAHWTGVNEVVNPDNTLAADALVIASRALNLQVCVLFQTDIAGSPLVLSSYCPGWISSHFGVSILESWFLRLLLPMLLAMTTGVHNPSIPLSNLSTRRLASFSATINIVWRYSLALSRWAEVELERSAGSLTLVKVTSVSSAFL